MTTLGLVRKPALLLVSVWKREWRGLRRTALVDDDGLVVERDYGQQLVEVLVSGLLLQRGGHGDAGVCAADAKLLVSD
jgi:hypothetical protein